VARGRPYNLAIAKAQKWAAKLHAAVYRATGGRIGGRMMNSPVLLLLTVWCSSCGIAVLSLPLAKTFLELSAKMTKSFSASLAGVEHRSKGRCNPWPVSSVLFVTPAVICKNKESLLPICTHHRGSFVFP
jgi:hypothetical protein